MKKINYNKAVAQYQEQFFGWANASTRKKIFSIFPFGYRYEDEKFIEVSIPLNVLDPSPVSELLIEKYKNLKLGTMEPIWISLGRKMKDGTLQPKWNGMIKILDGNHRAASMKKMKKKKIKVMMAESHYEFYMSQLSKGMLNNDNKNHKK